MAKKPSTAVLSGRGGGKTAASKAVATTRVSMSDAKGAERTVEVRKIENGFIVRESVYSPRKGYQSKERFEQKAPTLEVCAPKAKK